MHYSRTAGGFYTAEIHGTNIPADAVEISAELYQALLAGQASGLRIIADELGFPVLAPAPGPSVEALQEQFTAAIQERLDMFARTRNYDGILSACTYATSSVPKFSAEGQMAVLLRDQTWAAAYTILEEVQEGRRAMPESLADIEADLPVLAWPQ